MEDLEEEEKLPVVKLVLKKVDFPLLQEETDDDKFVEETIIDTKQQRERKRARVIRFEGVVSWNRKKREREKVRLFSEKKLKKNFRIFVVSQSSH